MNNILTFIVIAISGNPAILMFGKELTYSFVFMILLAKWMRKPVQIERSAIYFLLIICSLVLVHLHTFGSQALMSGIGFLITVAIGVLAATVINGFYIKYVRVMAVLACISLVFYIPNIFGVDLSTLLSFMHIPIATREGFDSIRHIGIHNFHIKSETRNSGMFWEPGAFAGYLVLALFLAIVYRRTSLISRWHVIALIAGLITTQSTMGYIAGLVVMIFYMVDRFPQRLRTVHFLSVPLIVTVGIFFIYSAVTQLEFIGEKIQEQIFKTQSGIGYYEINRFGNILYDYDFIREKPLAGWSGNPETRYSLDHDVIEKVAAQGVALTGFWVKYGALGWGALFVGLYITKWGEYKPIRGIFLVLTFFVLLVGEQYTGYPLLYAFLVGVRFKKIDKGNLQIRMRYEKISRDCV